MCLNCVNRSLVADQPDNSDQVLYGCCVAVQGYYCVWDLEKQSMECEEWAEMCQLRSVLHTVRHIAFSVVSERQRARTALNNLVKKCPFSECERFPWRKVYVNLSCGVYGNLWENLLSALDIKDREAEKNMKFKGGEHDVVHTSRDEYTMDDAKTQFRNTMKSFINELCKHTEVFDRVTFERHFNLTWCKGKCPGEPGGGKPPGNSPPEIPEPPDDDVPKFGELMNALKGKGFEPSDFRVFLDEELVKGDFECDRELMTLTRGIENLPFPRGAVLVLTFTDGAYSNCRKMESHVNGYVYYVKTGMLAGPIDLNEYRKKDMVKIFKSMDSNVFELFERAKFKYPNSRSPIRVRDEQEEFSGEQSGSSNSFEEVGGEV